MIASMRPLSHKLDTALMTWTLRCASGADRRLFLLVSHAHRANGALQPHVSIPADRQQGMPARLNVIEFATRH
ncbi:MAG: hypothetical protein ACREYE_33990 [Gammaproteobacteria bacterium]